MISRASSSDRRASGVTTSSGQVSLRPRFGPLASPQPSRASTVTVSRSPGFRPSGASGTISGASAENSTTVRPSRTRPIGTRTLAASLPRPSTTTASARPWSSLSVPASGSRAWGVTAVDAPAMTRPICGAASETAVSTMRIGSRLASPSVSVRLSSTLASASRASIVAVMTRRSDAASASSVARGVAATVESAGIAVRRAADSGFVAVHVSRTREPRGRRTSRVEAARRSSPAR